MEVVAVVATLGITLVAVLHTKPVIFTPVPIEKLVEDTLVTSIRPPLRPVEALILVEETFAVSSEVEAVIRVDDTFAVSSDVEAVIRVPEALVNVI